MSIAALREQDRPFGRDIGADERWEVTVVGQTKGDAATTGWVLVGAPLDCSGTGRGEARAPEALREAGLECRTAVCVVDR